MLTIEDTPPIRSSLDRSRAPKLSVIVVVYNIPREVPRTLLSLSAGYQRNIAPGDYEVIVVDNGSEPALDPEMVAGFGNSFRLIHVDPPPPSPAHAVNRGIAEARGDIVGVMIDGARIASPGLLHFALHGAQLYDKAVVATLGWYLGFDFQRFAMRAGYDAGREDALLASIKWPEDSYRLFEISTLDESSVEGWFCPIAESNALFLKRELWEALQGMDELFDAPGGGARQSRCVRSCSCVVGRAACHPSGRGDVSSAARRHRNQQSRRTTAAELAKMGRAVCANPSPRVPGSSTEQAARLCRDPVADGTTAFYPRRDRSHPAPV
jgi:Glycosyl transferase family 2